MGKLALSIVCLVIIVGLWITQTTFKQEQAPNSITFQTIEKIENYAKIIISPSLSIKKNILSFDLNIESFQNPILIDNSPLETILLKWENKVIEPIEWEELYKDEFSLKGILKFPISSTTDKMFTLTIFDKEKMNFYWQKKND